MIRKSEIVREAVKRQDWKKALSIAKNFRIGVTEEQRDIMTRGYECMVHTDFYRQLGTDIEEAIEKAKHEVADYVERSRKMNRYYLISRPAAPGAIPKGAENIANFDSRQMVPEIGREAWGYVEYTEPLTAEQIADYELVEYKGAKKEGSKMEKKEAKKMKWEDKHNKAKEVIGKFLGEAEMWFTSRELIGGLAEDEVGQVNEEVSLMIESIRKRYKIEAAKARMDEVAAIMKAKAEAGVEVAPLDPEKVEILEQPEGVNIDGELPVHEAAEAVKPAEEEKPKKRTRKPRTKKTEETSEEVIAPAV